MHKTSFLLSLTTAKLYAKLKKIGRVGGNDHPKKSMNLIPIICPDKFLERAKAMVAKYNIMAMMKTSPKNKSPLVNI